MDYPKYRRRYPYYEGPPTRKDVKDYEDWTEWWSTYGPVLGVIGAATIIALFIVDRPKN